MKLLNSSSSKGFTLVELLVVIAIIALLAGVSVVGISTATRKGQETDAKNTAVQIVQAVAGYKLEYQRMPSRNRGEDSEQLQTNSDFMRILLGLDPDLNSRKVTLIKTKPAKKGKNGPTNGLDQSSFELYDPWGQLFEVIIDSDNDGVIQAPAGSSDSEFRMDAIAWSKGAPRKKGETNSYKNWVKSWE